MRTHKFTGSMGISHINWFDKNTLMSCHSLDNTLNFWDVTTSQFPRKCQTNVKADVGNNSNPGHHPSTVDTTTKESTTTSIKVDFNSCCEGDLKNDVDTNLKVESKPTQLVPTADDEQAKDLGMEDRHILQVVHSPDGAYVVSISFKKVKVWNTETGELVCTLFEQDNSRWPMNVDWSSDGTKIVVLLHKEQAFKIFSTVEPNMWQEVYTGSWSPSPPLGTDIIPCKIHVQGMENGSVHITRGDSNNSVTTVLNLHEGPVRVAVLSDSGQYLLTAGDDGIAYILWHNSVKTRITVGSSVYAGAWNLANDQVILAGIGACAYVFDVNTGTQVHKLEVPFPVKPCTISSCLFFHSRLLEENLWEINTKFDSNKEIGHNFVFQQHTGALRSQGPHKQSISPGVMFSPSSKMLVLASYSGQLIVWDTIAKKRVIVIREPAGEIEHMEWCLNSKWVVIGSLYRVGIWDITQGIPVFIQRGRMESCGISLGGHLFAYCMSDPSSSEIKLLNLDTMTHERSIMTNIPHMSPRRLMFTPHQNCIVSYSISYSKQQIDVWNLDSRKLECTVTDIQAPYLRPILSLDGRHVIYKETLNGQYFVSVFDRMSRKMIISYYLVASAVSSHKNSYVFGDGFGCVHILKCVTE
eukprot:TRINITY_DN6746_c0_g1_i4.p1 TRINITY_DN6746_c0_g1~~TRINITY_DN6746_c0_g1_i4.p1  ORF type:complete len:638 (-),score=106.72 TRINITY_DN6746_c0_g1_i4:417-2330(-)